MSRAVASSLASPESVAAALAGRDGHDAIRAVVSDPLHHGVAELLDADRPGVRTRSLVLRRSKYKPGRLTAYYTVGEGAESAGRHAAVSWAADGSVTLLLSPTDPAMPQIARLVEPVALARLVGELSGLVRPIGGLAVTTVRYRPGQRHVLHARQPAGRAFYVKVDRDASGARAVPLSRALRHHLARELPAARVAEPVGYAPDEQAALWWAAPGHGLASVLTRQGGARLGGARVVAQLGRAVRVIHESRTAAESVPALEAVGVHAVEDEAASVLRAGEHIAALLPPVATTYADVVADVVDRLQRLSTEAATCTHGDLKADNILVDGARLHLLDLDRACWAEPAMDLGKLLADLRWWSRSRGAAAAMEGALRAGYGPCTGVRWARAELLATLFEVKFAARRCVMHDPRWPASVREQVSRAAERLRSRVR